MKKETIKIIKETVFMLIVFAIIVIIVDAYIYANESDNKSQFMNNLDYNVTLNEDGSMTVVETWDIYIANTNTIFKNFTLSSKFGNITNVKVKDLQTGQDLTRVYEYMYHVTDNCYYALAISEDEFEIAWGTGMEDDKGNKKYQISYTITDVVSDYNDCQELYWQFLSTSNEINVENVTGTITLPSNVTNIENLKAWGHGPLNGNISIESNNCVKFEVENLNAGKMLEVRVVTTDQMFNVTAENKINNYSYLSTIINEETEWADEANSTSFSAWPISLIIIYAVILIIQIIRIIQYYYIYKNRDDGIVKSELEYFRDIPREDNSTPAEAAYFYRFDKSMKMAEATQSDVVTATILDLALKKYISLRCEKNKVYVKILRNDEGLKSDEKAIYKLLKNAQGVKYEFLIDDLNKYALAKYNEYGNLINNMVNSARESLYKEGLVDKSDKKRYEKAKKAESRYKKVRNIGEILVIFYLVSVLITPFRRMWQIRFRMGFFDTCLSLLIILAPILITIGIKNKILNKTQTKIAVLTQKGYDEKNQWKALANYMEDYSLLNEKEVPSLVVWEKYLVYATTFGIAEKVIEQMKSKYPEVFVKEYWEDEKVEQYPILNFALYDSIYYTAGTGSKPMSSLRNNVTSSNKISASEISRHSSSSGSGGGGGFSGGGRRPAAVVAGMGGR